MDQLIKEGFQRRSEVVILELMVVGIWGLLIGSFLNVCIYRMPQKQSIQFPASHCMQCQHPLSPKDLIPIVSYLLLKGRCRYCNRPISKQYPLIEGMNAGAYMLSIYIMGFNFEGVLGCIFCSLLLVLSLTDWRELLLPTVIIRFGVIVALGLRAGYSYWIKDWSYLIEALIGGLGGYLFLAIVFYLTARFYKKEGMGYGDVRYLGMIGCFTSWSGVFLTLFISSVMGTLYGFFQMKRKNKSTPFPYGPFLSIGAWVSFFFGTRILKGYLDLMMI